MTRKDLGDGPYDHIHKKRIKVGNRTYVIEICDEIRDGSLDGLCKPTKQIIYISKGMSLDGFREVLIHEILHAIWYGQSIDYALKTDQLEEYLVGVLSANVMQVFQANKWLREILWD